MRPWIVAAVALAAFVLTICLAVYSGVSVQIINPKTAEAPIVLPVPPSPTNCDNDSIDGKIGSLPVIELPALVIAALPADGFQNMAWDYMVKSPNILWQTAGVNFVQSGTCRQGLARVRVAGIESEILLQDWTELGWSVSLWTTGNPDFGPTWIEIRPGGNDTNSDCFGALTTGCTFTPGQALASPLLQSHLICSSGEPGAPAQVYSVSAPNKKPNLIVFQSNQGSGGETDWLEIRPLSDTAKECQTP